MSRCPQCGRRLFPEEELCAACRNLPPSEAADELDSDKSTESQSQVAIARFTGSAEAGFFADELLRGTGIEPSVTARESFDAVHAVWSVDYVLLVARESAEPGARYLQELLERTSDESPEAFDNSSIRLTDLPARVWVPLILTLAAGSIACFGIERGGNHIRPAALAIRDPREPSPIWDSLAELDGPWNQEIDAGPGRRELRFDRKSGLALVREDQDGDGAFEREWCFGRDGRAVPGRE